MMNFETFAALWHQDTFLKGAFNDYQDIDAFLDDPTCCIGNPAYDRYQKELLDLEFPTTLPNLSDCYNSYEDLTELASFAKFFSKGGI